MNRGEWRREGNGRNEMQKPTDIHTLAYLGLRLRYKRGRVFMLPSLSMPCLDHHVEVSVRTASKHDGRSSQAYNEDSILQGSNEEVSGVRQAQR